jgi:hypothetical protein
MTRRHARAATALLGLAALLLLGSCSPRLGWGLLLWTAPEGPLPAGSIVPVYIKSNIQKVYVVGVPGLKGKEKDKKIELPLWQLELYPTRGGALARAKAMGENLSLYMVAARNGLILRDKPAASTGKQVFRLREGQSVKVLEKVEGETVSTGGRPLPGSWYLVLADDGTRGYIFSFALRIYDEAKEGPPVVAAAKSALSGRVDLIFSRSWRPEYFQEMLDDGRIDLDYFLLRYGLFVDGIRRQVRIELPAASEVFNYKEITESAGSYSFGGTPLKIKIESDKRIVCDWKGTDAAEAPGAGSPGDEGDASAAGAPAASVADGEGASYKTAGSGGSAAFDVLSTEPREAIRLETLRRQKLLNDFIDRSGSSWKSAASGLLDLSRNGRFTWKGRGEDAAPLVPEAAGTAGEIAFRLFLDPALSGSWEGSFSLRFDQEEPGKDRRAWLDFVYRVSPAGLVLAPAAPLAASLLIQAADSQAGSLVLEPAAE